jgi:hypothetical protein
MYWLERYMAVLKGYVRNCARVEGSITTGHLAAKNMFYCSNILATIDPSCLMSGWRKEKKKKTV